MILVSDVGLVLSLFYMDLVNKKKCILRGITREVEDVESVYAS